MHCYNETLGKHGVHLADRREKLVGANPLPNYTRHYTINYKGGHTFSDTKLRVEESEEGVEEMYLSTAFGVEDVI